MVGLLGQKRWLVSRSLPGEADLFQPFTPKWVRVRYGPRQPSEGAYSLVIPSFLRMREEGNPLTVYGDGTQTRSDTHVSDVVEANMLAATAELPAGKHIALNIGTGQETSVNEIAATIGGPVQHIVPNPRREFEEARKAADCSLAASLIGWEPRIPFAQGVMELPG